MAKEALAAEDSARITAVGKLQLMVRVGRVHCRRADLNDLQPGRAFEHTMPDLGRLDDQVALAHHKWLTTVLIDDADPTAPHIDDLQRNAVVVDPVGDRSAFRDRDMGCDVPPAETTRDQIAIEHPRAS